MFPTLKNPLAGIVLSILAWWFTYGASMGVYAAVLVDFQVAQPPPLPQDAKQCTVKILEWVSAYLFLMFLSLQVVVDHDFVW